MRNVLVALFWPFLMLANWLNVNGQDWRQIVPLTSTRAEVERLLGPATGAYFGKYKLKEGSLFIESQVELAGINGAWLREVSLGEFSVSTSHQ